MPISVLCSLAFLVRINQPTRLEQWLLYNRKRYNVVDTHRRSLLILYLQTITYLQLELGYPLKGHSTVFKELTVSLTNDKKNSLRFIKWSVKFKRTSATLAANFFAQDCILPILMLRAKFYSSKISWSEYQIPENLRLPKECYKIMCFKLYQYVL